MNRQYPILTQLLMGKRSLEGKKTLTSINFVRERLIYVIITTTSIEEAKWLIKSKHV